MKKILLAFILVLIYSCSTVREIEVDIAKSPKVKLPDEVKNITVIDRTLVEKTISENDSIKNLASIDSILLDEFRKGLTNRFAKKSLVITTNYPNRLITSNPKNDSFGEPLRWEKAETIAEKTSTDALLVIEYFNTKFQIKDSINSELENIITQTINADAKLGIRVYIPKTKKIFYENEFSYSRTINEQRLKDQKIVVNDSLIEKIELKSINNELGEFVANQFIPKTVSEKRIIVKGKTTPLKEIENQIVNGEYDNAIVNLENAFNSEQDAKLKADIAHNLAFCYEMKGKIFETKKWLSDSINLIENPWTKQYLDTINQRIKKENLVEEKKKE